VTKVVDGFLLLMLGLTIFVWLPVATLFMTFKVMRDKYLR
jgi:hypothetical protein